MLQYMLINSIKSYKNVFKYALINTYNNLSSPSDVYIPHANVSLISHAGHRYVLLQVEIKTYNYMYLATRSTVIPRKCVMLSLNIEIDLPYVQCKNMHILF